jgi:hypothetical protein
LLFVLGTYDQFTGLSTLEDLISEERQRRRRRNSEQSRGQLQEKGGEEEASEDGISLMVVPGADHFFIQRWDAVALKVMQWAYSALKLGET